MTLPRIAVVGSLNVDYTARVERFPQRGETVSARSLGIRFGGKGANQAVAASALGARVAMVGCLGDDEMGRAYDHHLEQLGVDTSGLTVVAGEPTGSAFINVDATAENTIVVAAGANGCLGIGEVAAARESIAAADVLLLQNEVPDEANRHAFELAAAAGTRVVYNPAPWDGDRGAEISSGGLLVVNQAEAAAFLGREVGEVGDLPDGVIVTRGGASTLANIDGRRFDVPAFSVQPVDTVGAGDAFVGALAFGLAEMGESEEVLRFANAAAAMATLAEGAQEVMPTRAQVEDLLKRGS